VRGKHADSLKGENDINIAQAVEIESSTTVLA
jgi:hypothetical protein